ncbi:unnamed protein product [Cylicocyclus nassatus]|uniref:Uncharacterized protein n=1 Tax=Cylicocyclus nassatus TaxID=53992 RepID=A0AA36GZ01_CYLNA|nr:unnamed protein product [Cylicocyclus nassatus]
MGCTGLYNLSVPLGPRLRDLLRWIWIHLFEKNGDMTSCFDTLYVRRMRKEENRRKLQKDDLIVGSIYLPRQCSPFVHICSGCAVGPRLGDGGGGGTRGQLADDIIIDGGIESYLRYRTTRF